MLGRFIFLFLVLFNLPSLFADQDIVKCFNLIATGKQNYAVKATNYLKKSLKTKGFSPEQRDILDQLIEVGDYFSLDTLKRQKKLKEIGGKFDIVRPCFTCKGTAVLKKVKRCSDCKVRGICYWCRGQGYRYIKTGNITRYDNCDKCEDGNCGVCKGEKFLDEDCTKCNSVTGNKIDHLKLKKQLKVMLESYLRAPAGTEKTVTKVNEDDFPEQAKEVKKATEFRIDISTTKILTPNNAYSGMYLKEGESLFIITYATSVFDPTQIKCLYNGKIIQHGEVYYSSKYQCYKIKVTENILNVKAADLGVFTNQTTYILNSTKNKTEFLKAKSNRSLGEIYASVGELAIQNKKVCGFFAKEKLVRRNNANWLTNKVFITKESYLPVKTDFLASFKLLNKDHLNSDLLFLSQYLEWEVEILDRLKEGHIELKSDLDKDFLKSLKKSFEANHWKTDWAKIISIKVIDTITSLESL